MKQLIVFDLDGTLAESKSPLSAEVGELLGYLLGVMKVAVISGGSFAQFETQALAYLHAGERLANLILLPTCGTQLFRFRDGWSQVYSEDLNARERSTIVGALTRALSDSGVEACEASGEQIENHGSQITLGQDAPAAREEGLGPRLREAAEDRRGARASPPRLRRPYGRHDVHRRDQARRR